MGEKKPSLKKIVCFALSLLISPLLHWNDISLQANLHWDCTCHWINHADTTGLEKEDCASACKDTCTVNVHTCMHACTRYHGRQELEDKTTVNWLKEILQCNGFPFRHFSQNTCQSQWCKQTSQSAPPAHTPHNLMWSSFSSLPCFSPFFHSRKSLHVFVLHCQANWCAGVVDLYLHCMF